MPFIVGEKVKKTRGYEFDSTVVAVFQNLSGDTRIVCESSVIPGLLHIFNEDQLMSVDLCGKCYNCLSVVNGPFGMPVTAIMMIVCSECGNKRCPKSTYHENECTGSNEPGQEGSRYS